jgi:Uma2 family endonuclease
LEELFVFAEGGERRRRGRVVLDCLHECSLAPAAVSWTAMARVSVEEYLSMNYKPACDYIDGVLRQKPMLTWKHSAIQIQLGVLINPRFRQFLAGSEQTVKIRTAKYYVPDLVVQRRDRIQDPYPEEPVHLCVEILSPEDRFGEIAGKCEDYLDWGVETVWIIDPESRRAWEFRKGLRPMEVSETGTLTAEGISVSMQELFSVL